MLVPAGREGVPTTSTKDDRCTCGGEREQLSHKRGVGGREWVQWAPQPRELVRLLRCWRGSQALVEWRPEAGSRSTGWMLWMVVTERWQRHRCDIEAQRDMEEYHSEMYRWFATLL